MHSLIAGSTGSGKTTLMKGYLVHAMKHGFPAVVIDPKGDQGTIEEIRALARKVGADPERIRVFSLARPDQSCTYHPLKHGSPIELKDRIMASLNWSEPYYESVASRYLSVIFPIFRALELKPTLRMLRMVIADPHYAEQLRKKLEGRVSEAPESRVLLTEYESLLSIKKQELGGLVSQLGSLDNFEFGSLLSPPAGSEAPKPEIDFRQIIARNEIAYFQLNTLAYGDSSRRLGRIILEDLKALSAAIQSGQVARPEFLPIFVDEFGAFASPEFIEFLKQCRSAHFALHLFCQSLADLKAVYPEFMTQILDNVLSILVLRQNDPSSVDVWSGVAGTEDSEEMSYQVEGLGFWRRKTGAGNLRMTKQMRIEHDVFKRLSIGQAVLMEKSPSREDLIQLWMPRVSDL